MQRSWIGFSTPSVGRAFQEAGRQLRQEIATDASLPRHVLLARTTMLGFARRVYPGYVAEPAHELICKVLDDVVEGRIKRVMIFAPPQMGKSLLTSTLFPAYWLGRRPDDPVVLTSYGANLAFRFTRRCREIIRSPEYRQVFPRTVVGGTSTAVQMWELDDRRGYVAAAGVGGPIMGLGAALGIIDDPVKNAAEAHSRRVQEDQWEWYRSTFLTRLWEDAAVLLIMSRWDVNDLAGRILQAEQGWTVVRIPCLAETQVERDEKNKVFLLPPGLPDPLGRKPGEAATPIRFSKEAAEERKEKVGPSTWEAMYQGCPVQMEGNLVSRSNFRIVQALPQGLKFVRYWDKAATAGGGTFTVGILMAKDARKDAPFTHYIVHMVRGQWGTYERERIMQQTAESDKTKYGKVAIRFEVEGGSSGKDVERDTIRRFSRYDIKGEHPTGSKEVRFIPFARQVEAGNVALLAGDWNEVYLDNIVLFPNGGLDEADATSGAYNSLEGAKRRARASARVKA